MRLLCYALGVFFLVGINSIMAQNFDAAWKEIAALQETGKYRSALEKSEALYQLAAEDGAVDQQLKALFYRLAFTQELEEDGQIKAIELLQKIVAEPDNAPAPVLRSVQQYVLGRLLLAQLENYNRRPTAVAQVVEDPQLPIVEWPNERLMRQGAVHLLEALETARQNRTALTAIPAIVAFHSSTLYEAPTLYELLVFEVLSALNQGSAYMSEPVYAFRPTAEQLFATATTFRKLEVETQDTSGLHYRSLLIYQDLLSAHQGDKDKRTSHYANLRRLEWAFQVLRDQAAFFKALQTDYPTNGDGDWLFRQATLLEAYPELGAIHADGSVDEAAKKLHLISSRRIAEQVVKAFPTSRAAQEAKQFIAQLNMPRLRATAEEVVVPQQAVLVQFSYQNIEQLHYQLVRLTQDLPAFNYQEEEWAKWRKLTPQQKGRLTLAKNDDLKEHSSELALEQLPPGKYGLLLSADAAFNQKKAPVAALTFTVSQLALLQYKQDDAHTGLVLNRQTGEAISGVELTFYKQTGNYNNPKWKIIGSTISDQEGHFDFKYDGYNNLILLKKADDQLISNYNEHRDYDNTRETRQTHLFLDRGIYRPGQTIYFKGLATKLDTQGRPVLLKGETQSLSLHDVNGQEVAAATFTTDIFGAFDGQFVLPATGLNGMYNLRVSGAGSRSFRLEAYKRPRFEVLFEPNEEPIAEGDSVEVVGRAIGFAGPAVAAATVNYRVERKLPTYFRWWWGGQDSPDAILASGSTQTDDSGAFSIRFEAILPSGATAATGKGYFRPSYQFVVYADVVDVTGETHAATTSRFLQAKGSALQVNSPAIIDKGQVDSLAIGLSFPGAAALEAHRVQISLEPVAHPDPALVTRRWGMPDRPVLKKAGFKAKFPHLAFAAPGPVEEWPSRGKLVVDQPLRTATDTVVKFRTALLATGHYRLVVRLLQADGADQVERLHLQVLDTQAGELPEGMLNYLAAQKEPVLPGEEAEVVLLTQQNIPLVLYQWNSRAGKKAGRESIEQQKNYRYLTTDEDRGGLQFNHRFVQYNRVFDQSFSFTVPWPTKELVIQLASFRDKLLPGAEETWQMTIQHQDGSPADAQLLASMYDAALDQLQPFAWGLAAYPNSFYIYEPFNAYAFGTANAYGEYDYEGIPYKEMPASPRLITDPIQFSYYNYGVLNEVAVVGRGRARQAKMAAPMMGSAPPAPYSADSMEADGAADATEAVEAISEAVASEEAAVSIRKNLQETAFWYPNLRTNAAGGVELSFNSPEALTRWKFQLLAHTQDLAYATASHEVVTQKELMITPNAPRFLREGDRIVFTAKVSNLSEGNLAGMASLELFDPATQAVLELADSAKHGYRLRALQGAQYQVDNQSPFSLAAGESQGLRWEITVPAGAAGEIGYRVIARSPQFSDGEQNVLPVLSNRIFLTASKPFFLRSGQQKTVVLQALEAANQAGGNLIHKGFSFELTNDPSWLVVKSLPYLIEYPYDCTEQIANRFFANQLSYTIVDKNPAFRAVFEQWRRDSSALVSPLALRADLKQALLEETPWLREAADESEQKERLATLFEVGKLAEELDNTLAKLENRQNPDGSFSWFPQGPSNRYMTQYVAETVARLHNLEALDAQRSSRVLALGIKTIGYLDFELGREYKRLLQIMKQKELDAYQPSSIVLHYLYVRTTTPAKDIQLEGDTKTAFNFYMQQAKKHWTDYGLQEQALLAIIFAQTGHKTGSLIIESLRERAIRSEELGMYWKYNRGFRWQELPTETHSRLIEAFGRYPQKVGELDEMRLFLLQNKRTNRWETTKATAAAAYAFLQSGGSWLQTPSAQKVKVKFPNLPKSVYEDAIDQAEQTAEAGTGYYRLSWGEEVVRPAFAKVELSNKKGSVAWGGLYWQFTQDIDAVQAANESPLTLKRRLFRRVNTAAGVQLEAITPSQPMRPGERLVVQLVVETDRDMEYIHLKDRRAAGLEPTTQLSQYKYEGGLGFYFSPDDLAVHYFIDYLPRGTYTLEYDLFVNHAGDFSNGLSVLQSMYAPEFSAYSDGSRLIVE